MTVRPPTGQEGRSSGVLRPCRRPPAQYQVRYRAPSRAAGIMCTISGALGVLLAPVILIVPYMGWFLAGGGDPDAPGSLYESVPVFGRAALGIFIVSAALLTVGIVLTVRANRCRCAWRQGLEGA